jgi:hypothetical protein
MHKAWIVLAFMCIVIAGATYATIQWNSRATTMTPHSPSLSHSGKACVTSAPSGSCGPYSYQLISWDNGYNNSVGNNMWGCGSGNCGPQTVTAYNPGNWSVTSNQAAGNTGVLTYPDVQQVFGRWDGKGNVPLSGFSSITSDFTEEMNGNHGTDAEAGYDIWLSGTKRSEVMIWVDNVGRGNGGATLYGHTTIRGQAFTVYTYGSGEIIVSLDKNETSGTVDLLATLRWLQAHGLVSSSAALGQVDFGWEICSTGGRPETFTISKYSLTSTCVTSGCMG